MSGATLGISPQDPTVGQFGKNHIRDRNGHLPTGRGFDELFGNRHHLYAEEEPYFENYPKDPKFRERLGPCGVLKGRATDRDVRRASRIPRRRLSPPLIDVRAE